MKNKALLALVLAVALLIAGAFLPGIVGAIMDRSASNKMEFAQVNDIQLEFVQTEIPIEEILGILCKGTHAVEIPGDLAGHSQSDILRLAQQAVGHYQDAGLIPHIIDFSADLQSCTPQLRYQQASSRKSNIFWNIILEPSDNSWRLEMVLDDRTGILCSINYDYRVIDTNSTNLLYPDRTSSLTTFSSLFLQDLGGSFAEMTVDALSVNTPAEDDYTSATITWADTIKGECHIVLYMLDSAFYTLSY